MDPYFQGEFRARISHCPVFHDQIRCGLLTAVASAVLFADGNRVAPGLAKLTGNPELLTVSLSYADRAGQHAHTGSA
jgi:hypothetical protein